ncbi:FecCD family ABC transporter permease [Amorphus coralli]|uniref:FecCD family ABC transporter permease n=1 Tax=Amorphus coralli TaxID=340680 RepID=UPI00037972FF|nr:iron ABC transporter permease [Amorphus coralli]
MVSHGGLLMLLATLTAALFAASLAVGYAPLDLGAATGDAFRGEETVQALVFVELRLPRAILGLLVGFTLGLAGAVMQGFLRNPLAEPGVVGVSGGAAFGAVLVFYSGLAALSPLILPAGGILAALLVGALLFAVAGRGMSTTTLILAGVAINSLAGALISLTLNLAPNPYAAMEIMFWLMGSLADRSFSHVWVALGPMVVGWVMLLSTARALDALSLGEATARTLGFDLRRVRAMVVGGVALSVGAATAVAGVIGFVGLIVPHLVRPLVGHRPGRLLIASGLSGASLTLAADVAVRLIPTRPELQLGVVTAIIGAPFLFSLVWRYRRVER